MDKAMKRRSEAGDLAIMVGGNWSPGPRTEAWDLLWQLMLRGLDRQSGANAGQRIGRNDADG